MRLLLVEGKFFNGFPFLACGGLLGTVLEAQRKDFLENELPQILKRMKLLGIDLSVLNG